MNRILAAVAVSLISVAATGCGRSSAPDEPQAAALFNYSGTFRGMDRTIAREPKYLANPLYGLIVFDIETKARVWFVLDKSSTDKKEHDVLYLDRNGNGDLTESGERYVTPVNEGGTVVHETGPIKINESGPEHTEFKLYASMVQRGISPFFRVKLGGKDEMWGGFSRPGERSGLGSTPEKAPVFVASLQPPLTFQLFLSNGEFLTAGNARIAVVVGVPGNGPGTFMGVHENYLVPGKDRLFGTWIGKNFEGREVRERFEIKGHC